MPKSPHLSFTIDMIHPVLEFVAAKFIALNPARLAARQTHDELFQKENHRDGYKFADIVFLRHFFRKERKFAYMASYHPRYRAVCDTFSGMQFKDHAAVASGFTGDIDTLVAFAAAELHQDIVDLRVKLCQCVDYNNELVRTAYDYFGPVPKIYTLIPNQKLELTLAETARTGYGNVHRECQQIQRENDRARHLFDRTSYEALDVSEADRERDAMRSHRATKRRKATA